MTQSTNAFTCRRGFYELAGWRMIHCTVINFSRSAWTFTAQAELTAAIYASGGCAGQWAATLMTTFAPEHEQHDGDTGDGGRRRNGLPVLHIAW